MAKPSGLGNIWASSGAITDPGSAKEILGWVAEIPPFQYFNYIFNKITAALDNLNSWGILEWDIDTPYAEGAKVMYSGVTYTLVTASDTGTTPGTDTDVWNSKDSGYYDYVVDSDAKLQALCDGTVSGATSVFVASGTWTATSGTNWDLDSTDTKQIIGCCGSVLAITDSDYGVYHSSSLDQSNTSEYNISSLEVSTTNGTGTGYGFYNCNNLTNCTGTGTGTGAGSGFSTCNNLTNCTGTGTGTGATGYGFSTCDNLTNCTGTGTGIIGRGFSNCDNLTSCTGNGTGTGTGYGFYNCNNLTNGTGTGTGTGAGSGAGHGFSTCINLTNCTGNGTGTGTGYGFYNCNNLTNGTGTGTGATGYGFSTCEYVYAPSDDSSGSTATFYITNGVQTNVALS